MRIGIVFNSTARLQDSSIRYERYREGFRSLGHETLLITTEHSATGFEVDRTVRDQNTFEDPNYWKSIQIDIAVVPTWMGMVPILQAMREHVRCIINLTDTDGYIGARSHPRQLLRRMMAMQSGYQNKMRTAVWWIKQYLYQFKKLDKNSLQSAELSDILIVFSPTAKTNLAKFFATHQRLKLSEKVFPVTYPVDSSFESTVLPTEKKNQVVAIGRWEDPQKRVRFLAELIRKTLQKGVDTHFLVFGSGAEKELGPLVDQYPNQVRYRRVVPNTEIRQALVESQILLSTSLWESGPIVALESLLCGCTVVGPQDIPGFRWLSQGGRFGTTYQSHSPQDGAVQLVAELMRWKTKERNPVAISSVFQKTFTSRYVCSRLVDIGMTVFHPQNKVCDAFPYC